MPANPRFIVDSLFPLGQSIVLSSSVSDTAAGSALARQLSADIAAGNNFLGQYATQISRIPVLDQSRKDDWNYLASQGSVIVLAGDTWLDPGIPNVWRLQNTQGTTYSLQVRNANLLLTLNNSGGVFTQQASQPIIAPIQEKSGTVGLYSVRLPSGWIF
jgi:hypothetical protein